MQIDTAEKLITALRASELFTPEQLWVVVHDLTGQSDDLPTLLRVLVDKGRCTIYQLRKVIHGKAAELKVGPYVISDKLGEGGMGKVYRARHIRMGREVALKVVRSSLLSSKVVRKRYDREVQIASSLSHPNVVRVFDAGESNGKFYLAMEFVDGIDLSKMVRNHKPLAVAEACEYARQAAVGLHYAHEQDLVHRDIKPSNIVVAGERHIPQATEPSLVKVLDMGLVRTVGFDDEGGGDLTRAGTVVGTPDYMAPEQAKNSSGVDRRADLYSLGCTLYFLLTAQPPFPNGTAIEKLLKHQLDVAPALPSVRSDVSAEVAAIVDRLMAKKPEDRYQTAAEAAEALASVSRYQEDSAPVRSANRPIELAAPAGETPIGVGWTALPPLPPSSNTVQAATTDPAVASSDKTPRPREFQAVLHAVPETASPFASLTEPPSGPVEAIVPGSRQDRAQSHSWFRHKEMVWVAAAAAALIVAGAGLWMVFGGKKRAAEQANQGESESITTNNANENNAKPPRPITPAPKTPPTPSVPRRTPWADLVVADPGLIVFTTPASFLRDKSVPVAGGVGRTGEAKLVGWATRLAASTGLSLADSERLFFSMPAGSLDHYLAVSEGPYLTSSFATNLMATPGIRPFRQAPKSAPGVKWFQSGSRFMALVPTAGTPAYGLASDPPLLASMAARLASDQLQYTPRIDPGMAGAIDAALAGPPPTAIIVAGPGFRLPFEFITPDRSEATLRDFGIELVSVRLEKRDLLEVELAVVGRDGASLRYFLPWVIRKIGDEYPSEGGYLMNLIGKQETPVDISGGKFRATFRWSFPPARWLGFIDRLSL